MMSVTLNVLLMIILLCAFVFFSLTSDKVAANARSDVVKWHGGHPLEGKAGSCFCGHDKYCMCTPSLAIDLVISSGDDHHMWLVQRKDTNQFATMGGFVEVGETTEQAVKRELREELKIELTNRPVLLGVYSDPRRDNRRHTVSAAYAVHLDGTEQPHAHDDAKDVKRIPLADIEKYEYFADHLTILKDYRRTVEEQKKRNNLGAPPSSRGDFALDVHRDLCVV